MTGAVTLQTTGGPPVNDNILLVDDDPRTIQIMGRILAPLGNLRFATSGREALRLARESPPDLVLLDADMPEMSGFDVCAAMKSEPTLSDVPVIFVTNHSESAFEVTAFELGAVDFIAKPVSAPLVLARVRTQLRLKRLADELRRSATTDGLTGVANRRQFDDVLEREGCAGHGRARAPARSYRALAVRRRGHHAAGMHALAPGAGRRGRRSRVDLRQRPLARFAVVAP